MPRLLCGFWVLQLAKRFSVPSSSRISSLTQLPFNSSTSAEVLSCLRPL